MDPESSLPLLQEPLTDPYSEPDQYRGTSNINFKHITTQHNHYFLEQWI